MKALIVEDELLARLGMRSLIDWTSMGIDLLEDACNGREALERIEREAPELILLDLNIPEINGLDLLQIIKERHLSSKVIVVSCYEDFDTVKKAMKLGAVDYIRKFGLSKEELIAALRNLIDMPIEIPPYLQQSAVQNGIKLRKKLQDIPQEFMKGDVLSFYMLWKYSDEMTDMKIVESVACQYFQKRGQKTMSFFVDGKLLVFLKEETTEEETEQLRKLISHFVRNRCFIGITPYALSAQDENFFVAIANTAECYGFYDCGKEVFLCEKPFEIKQSFDFDIQSYMEKIALGLSKLSENVLAETLSGLFDEIKAQQYISVNIVKKLMIEILSSFSEKARSLHGAIEEIEVMDSFKHYQKIANSTCLKNLEEWWEDFIPKFANQFFTRQKKSESDIIQTALDYIEKNLDKPIQLAEVAQIIGVSEPYLSSFFKSSMNENFIPYVNKQKMKKARQLLTDGRLVYQVSDELGYENATYFSKVFKKIVGDTPEQYRKKYMK